MSYLLAALVIINWSKCKFSFSNLIRKFNVNRKCVDWRCIVPFEITDLTSTFAIEPRVFQSPTCNYDFGDVRWKWNSEIICLSNADCLLCGLQALPEHETHANARNNDDFVNDGFDASPVISHSKTGYRPEGPSRTAHFSSLRQMQVSLNWRDNCVNRKRSLFINWSSRHVHRYGWHFPPKLVVRSSLGSLLNGNWFTSLRSLFRLEEFHSRKLANPINQTL